MILAPDEATISLVDSPRQFIARLEYSAELDHPMKVSGGKLYDFEAAIDLTDEGAAQLCQMLEMRLRRKHGRWWRRKVDAWGPRER